MKTCSICKKQVRTGEKVVIISQPIEILNNNGDFNIFGDFFANQKVIHVQCFIGNQQEDPLQDNSIHKTIDRFCDEFSPIVKELHRTLQCMGEHVSYRLLGKFCLDLATTDLKTLIIEYFKHKPLK